jgi:hypothetical protein
VKVLKIPFCIAPVAGCRPDWGAEQSLPLVEAHCLNIDFRQGRQLADPHTRIVPPQGFFEEVHFILR